MKLAQHITNQAKKLGIDTTTDEFKTFITGVAELEIPDAVATKLETGLFSFEAAKSNTDLTKYFRAANLDPADQRMLAVATELGIDLDDDFKGTNNSYDKIAKLGKLALEAGKKKAGAANPGEATKWADKEREYNDQIRQLKEGKTASDSAWQQKLDDRDRNHALEKMLFGKDYIFPKEMDRDAQINTARTIVENELNRAGFKIKIDNGQLKIVNAEGQPAYDTNNAAIEPDNYFTGVLTRNKILKVNDAGGGNGGNQGGGNGGGNNNQGSNFVPGGGAGNGGKVNTAVVNELDNLLQNMPQ